MKAIDCEAVVKAMIDVGLIQFDPERSDCVYSVYGFSAWEHDEDLVTAIHKIRGQTAMAEWDYRVLKV